MGEAKWQPCPTRSMLVTSPSDSSFFDTENSDVYIRRTARCYTIPQFAWHETNRNSSNLCETGNDGFVDVRKVRTWLRQFNEGRTSREYKLKGPRPRTSRYEDMIVRVE